MIVTFMIITIIKILLSYEYLGNYSKTSFKSKLTSTLSIGEYLY